MGARRMKIVGVVLLATLIITAFVAQERSKVSLRAENASLRGEVNQPGEVAELRLEKERLAEQLKVAAEGSDQERRELLQLRGQVAALRQAAQESAARKTEKAEGGVEVRVSGIGFKGNSVLTEAQLASVLGSKIGEPLDHRQLSKDAYAIYEAYRKAGYEHVSVQPTRENASAPGEITFEIGEGNQEAGIGIQVNYVKPHGALHIQRVLPNTPAEAAGLAPGLYIEEIDGKATRDLSQAGCVNLLRGPAGTPVRLGLWDAEHKTNVTIVVNREKLVL